jgi:hypothetical protein
MTDSERARLVGRALLDDEFRSRLLEDPQKAARSLRIKLSPVEAVGVRRLDPQTLTEVAQQVQQLAGKDDDGHQGITW